MYTVCIILYVILVHVIRIQVPDGCSNCPHFQLITDIPAFGIYLILFMSSVVNCNLKMRTVCAHVWKVDQHACSIQSAVNGIYRLSRSKHQKCTAHSVSQWSAAAVIYRACKWGRLEELDIA